MSRKDVGADALRIPHGNRISAGDGYLFLIVPFEAVARRHDIGCGGHLEALARDDSDLLVHIVHGLVADDGLPLALDCDVPVGIKTIDLGLASRSLHWAVMSS